MPSEGFLEEKNVSTGGSGRGNWQFQDIEDSWKEQLTTTKALRGQSCSFNYAIDGRQYARSLHRPQCLFA